MAKTTDCDIVALLCGRVEDCYHDQSMLSVLFG